MNCLTSALVASAFLLSIVATPAGAQTAAENSKSKCQACHGITEAGDTPTGKKLSVNDFHAPDVQKKTQGSRGKAIS
jgi:hypothetical protein